MTAGAPEPSPVLLWQGTAPFEGLHRKSAATLLALVREISRRASAVSAERDFLAAHAAARAHGDAVFARVWTAPPAAAFAHRAYDLLRAGRAGDPDAERALSAHLDAFGLFALGAALVGGGALRLARPLALPRPVAIPGTALVLRGRGPLLAHGADGGALEVSAGDGQPLRLTPGDAGTEAVLAPAPLASHAGLELPLGAEVFELPGLARGEALDAVPEPEWARERAPAVAAALAVLERHAPEPFAQMRSTLRGVALKPRGAGSFQGMSFSDFPGASIIPFSPQPCVLAEGLIHEFHHQRLFAIESGLALVEPGADEPRHYSPFRPDPRPVRGLLHGLYVFVAVWRYWDAVRREAADPTLAAFGLDRVLRIALNLVLGRRQLEAAADGLTLAGRAVLALLSQEVEGVVDAVERAALPLEAPALLCDEAGQIRPATTRGGLRLTVADALGAQLRRWEQATGPAGS